MSIRIVPQSEVSNTAGVIPPLLFPNLKHLYTTRAERLRTLAVQHPLSDYLHFVANVVEAQSKILFDHPLKGEFEHFCSRQQQVPLDFLDLERGKEWQIYLVALLEELQSQAPEPVQPVLEFLLKASEQEREHLASELLQGNFQRVGTDHALFLWAALSLYWAQLAAKIPGKGLADYGEHRQFCPVCNSMPVASVIHIGDKEGLRYLHCSLCETQWHVVRVKCSNCEQTSQLSYWSLENNTNAIKAESCGDCGSYLKALYQQHDHHLEVIADDLASLILDAKMEEEGFARSSINPFLFPGD